MFVSRLFKMLKKCEGVKYVIFVLFAWKYRQEQVMLKILGMKVEDRFGR